MQYPILPILIILSLTGCSQSIRSQQQLLKDVKELSSDKYQGRKTGTKGNRMASEYITQRFKELNLKAFNGDYRHSFPMANPDVTGSNLLAYVQGKSDSVIVISAHYDHVGVLNSKIYNGADDNASGVAGLLALARHFSKNKPEHTLIFAAFDAEETGLQGAKAFVASPPVPLPKIKLNINMDMISRSNKNELYVSGSYSYPQLKKFLFTTNPKIKLLVGHDNPKQGRNDWTNQSDHYAFHQKKIPFLYFGVEDHKDYHQPSDDYENINKEFYENAVDVIQGILSNIDRNYSIKTMFRDRVIMKQ